MSTAILPDEEYAQLAQSNVENNICELGMGTPSQMRRAPVASGDPRVSLKLVDHLIQAITAGVQREVYESMFPHADTYQCRDKPLEMSKAMSDPDAIHMHAAK